ncbi:MAG: oxygen-dependent coproporphyrinogen oxidase [Planctomycetota bacterium]
MRRRAEDIVRGAQDAICAGLAELDGNPFHEDRWTRPDGGGGRSRVLQEGRFFEKAGVNVSTVHGVMPPAALQAARARGVEVKGESARFFATGVSLVLHPHNPFAPTAHANYRYFELEGEDDTGAWWFGGGADLTPSYLFEEDAVHFHSVLKERCDRHDPRFYPEFKAWCDRYFRIEHRDESRGVGGIFFDDLADREPSALADFIADCADGFLPSILPIYERRDGHPFQDEHRRWQQLRRGRYVEFNLVYDRGTTFGLRTKGRTESILMSLPLTARWEYDHHPAAGSEEARLLEVLRTPREWVAATE